MTNPQRDVFQELLALCSPERLLNHPQATGEGVSVCVVDSGVEESLVRASAEKRGQSIKPIQGGVFLNNQKEPLPYTGKQSTPHGTTVADILFSLAPNVQMYSADVFGPAGSCQVEVVIKAIHWAVNVWKCKIINLSLGVAENRLVQLPRRYQFLRAIEDGYFKDALIFAAPHNDHPFTKSYPAMFSPPLISVDKKEFAGTLEFAYSLTEQIEFAAYSHGYLGPFATAPATSWATPHLSGIAARLLSLKPDMKPFELKTVLYWMSQAKQE